VFDRDLADIAKAVSAAARGGDMTAAKLVLARLVPVPRGAPVRFDLPPELGTAGAVAATFTNVLAAMASGELTPEEAASVAAILESARRSIETMELEARLAVIEAQLWQGAKP
jgi:hypothetical protein